MDINSFLSEVSFDQVPWDDFGYETSAKISIDLEGEEKKFFVKIHPNTDENFERIKNNRREEENVRFLFGMSQDYYQFIVDTLDSEDDRNTWFELTGDIAYRGQDFINYYNKLENEWIEELKENKSKKESNLLMFNNSFFRDKSKVDWQELLNALHRLTVNKSFLSNYKFTIEMKSGSFLEIDVKPKDNIFVDMAGKSLPLSVSNNVFCIIGENGSGKTSFIRELAKAIFNDSSEIKLESSGFDTQEDANIMNKVIYCSFSPFDKEIIINSLSESDSNDKFKYIGFLEYGKGDKSVDEEIIKSILSTIKEIKNDMNKYSLWINVMERVSFEKWIYPIIYIFQDELVRVSKSDGASADGYDYRSFEEATKKVGNLSSGQKIFLLTISKLILNLTERTVVFVDEPELFLHPPMVKAYVRLISDLVSHVNGLGFIITHSPVTLQEFPDKCVKRAYKNDRGEYMIEDINFRTFGENINVINDKIFNIGLQQTGYYNLIERLKFDKSAQNELDKISVFSGSEARLLISLFLEGNSK